MKSRNSYSLLAGIGIILSMALSPCAARAQVKYKIAVADIMILKRQKLGAIQLTKDIGADGVEVDMGGLGDRPTFDNKLVTDSVRQQYLSKAKELNIQICSIGMTGFFSQSFAVRPTAVQAVTDCINTMKLMGVKIAFLPLGINSDLVKNPELRPAIVERLKTVGKLAQQAGVIIGIETSLDAKSEVQLLKEIGSPAVKSYFSFENAIKAGRDISEELKTLGAKNIIQIHCTGDDGFWLQNDPKINMPQIKATLDKMNWSGWLVLERSRVDAGDPKNVKKNFSANTVYLKSIFQAAK